MLADQLRALRVSRVVMEATSDYWKPMLYLLEAAGFEVCLVNGKDVKHLRGRPKTDTIDAVWLCKVAEPGMLRPSFVPPEPIRLLRDLTRYRLDLVGERGPMTRAGADGTTRLGRRPTKTRGARVGRQSRLQS